MRRRDLLAATAAIAAGATVLYPASAVAGDGGHLTVEDVIFGNPRAEPVPLKQLTEQVAAARSDFRAVRFTRLAQRLPTLLATATSTLEQAAPSEHARAARVVSAAYAVTGQMLLKLHDNSLAAATVDRAMRYARHAGDPLLDAEAARLAATVLRRGPRHRHAQNLILQSAEQLRQDTGLTSREYAAVYARLVASAAYTAALGDDRDTAWNLLNEAGAAFVQSRTDGTETFNRTELAVYRVSISRVLGDYGSAIDFSRDIDPATITSPERRARYWQDTALALYGRGRTDHAFTVLQTAEADTPQEVRHRPWAQQLTAQLLHQPGPRNNRLRDFAARIGVK